MGKYLYAIIYVIILVLLPSFGHARFWRHRRSLLLGQEPDAYAAGESRDRDCREVEKHELDGHGARGRAQRLDSVSLRRATTEHRLRRAPGLRRGVATGRARQFDQPGRHRTLDGGTGNHGERHATKCST